MPVVLLAPVLPVPVALFMRAPARECCFRARSTTTAARTQESFHASEYWGQVRRTLPPDQKKRARPHHVPRQCVQHV
jgi:hypothetical protein